jgi:hypothetical protein
MLKFVEHFGLRGLFELQRTEMFLLLLNKEGVCCNKLKSYQSSSQVAHNREKAFYY